MDYKERREEWLNEYINLNFICPLDQWPDDAKADIRESFAFSWWCLGKSLRRLGHAIIDAIKHTYGGKR